MKKMLLISLISILTITSIIIIALTSDFVMRGEDSLLHAMKTNNEETVNAYSEGDNTNSQEKEIDKNEEEDSAGELESKSEESEEDYIEDIPEHLIRENDRTESTEKQPTLSDHTVAHFGDKDVEANVREKLDKYDELTVKDLKSIKDFNTRACNLEGIEYLVNLEYLYLYGSGCDYDISPLYELKSLRKLALKDSTIQWMNGLGELASIESLVLEDSGSLYRDFPLSVELLSLKELIIYDNLTDIGGIVYTPNLQELEVFAPSLDNIEPLSELGQLKRLSLKASSIKEVSSLRELDHLVELDLSSTDVEDISGLSELKSLETIDLSGTYVKDVDALLSLPNLKKVDLLHTKLLDPNSESLKQLKEKVEYVNKAD
ncbi:leucine-rich repeat domain-containing protein [Virgibacillus halodenitrificans]|uniref:leucine-rich repeat domain-containing protein n=1 Tax=Virgibacillus halodenitrificans TaxID=1482 RepID=UPI000EF47FF2|nr:leucine-rich repeat domain-containing protein [Virgibacillus halodenitrificans]